VLCELDIEPIARKNLILLAFAANDAAVSLTRLSAVALI
jgi:hypothetical protein